MTSLPDRPRPATTWIVIVVVAVLALVAVLLAMNLLRNLGSGVSPSANESPIASASSGPSETPLVSSPASSTPSGQTGGAWTATGSMLEARAAVTATLLPDGEVLVAGGALNSAPYVLASAELYDPSTGSWTATGPMIEARYGYTATLLPDGEVLVAGGSSTIVDSSPFPLATAELYDPRMGTWAATGSMATPRTGHTATLLPDGKVLVVGGVGQFGDYIPASQLATAELYDPATSTWTPTGNLNEARDGHTATLLSNGSVLVAGGCCDGDIMRASAELYDPSTNKWTPSGSMSTARQRHTATLLSDGKVLVVGGHAGVEPDPLGSAELYDPDSGSWNSVEHVVLARSGHTATLLATGEVLLVGSSGNGAPPEVYDPNSGSWTIAGEMIEARPSGHAATLLPDGKVLVVGGSDNNGEDLSSAEVYDLHGGP